MKRLFLTCPYINFGENKMKIAIITWFHNYNYGTYLQAYSLQHYLKALGHEATLIKYENSASDIIKEPINGWTVLINKIKNNIFRRLNNRKYKKALNGTHYEENQQKKQKMDAFLEEVNFTEQVKNSEDFNHLEERFDCFICGSDQIWNPKILNGKYYLDFVKEKPKIAYADSFSLRYLPTFSLSYIQKWLHDFVAIGMREATGKELVDEILDSENKAQNVCDPTLLLYDHWRSMKFKKTKPERYIFGYFLGSRRYYGKVLEKLAGKLECQVVSIPMNDFGIKCGNWVDFQAGVEEFLSYIQNAEYICADSFHAVVFSVIYEKQFVVLNKYKNEDLSSQNSRIIDFLHILGLEDRVISETQLHKLNMMPMIDYTIVNIKIKKFIDSSESFLLEALKKAEELIK